MLAQMLPAADAHRVADDPAVGALAHTLAATTPPGGDPADVLAAAIAYRGRGLRDAD